MISIDRHIAYLLLGHDCVIVPGLGAFVAQYQSAVVSGREFAPPTREVSFNPYLTHNDGLLASSIARYAKMSYEAACKSLTDAVAGLRQQLTADGHIAINRVGTLTVISEEGDLEFTPDPRPITSLPFLGLPSADATTIAERQADEAVEERPSPKVVTFTVPLTFLRVAASVAILAVVGLVCSTPKLADTEAVNKASLSAPTITLEQDLSAGYADVELPQLLIAPPKPLDGEAEAVVKKKSKKRSKSAESVTVNMSGNYGVVVASLKSRKGAEKFVRQHSSDGLQIIRQEGRYRVIITTAATEDSAKAIAASRDIQRRYPGAWVTVK